MKRSTLSRPGSAPLWLPRGSIRALIALAVIGVWAALETQAVGGGASDALRSMAIAVAAGYGVLRDREQQRSEGREGGGRRQDGGVQ